jgi:RimJ/RimL family protein N-acetyltransferase
MDFASTIALRRVADDDMSIFFAHQLDEGANHMAAFTRKNHADRDAFDQHWRKIRDDRSIIIRTILYNTDVVGHVLSYEQDGQREMSYWIGREFWGKGIATCAVAKYLREVRCRPVYARAAADNLASIRVLEKCGFTLLGQSKWFANARGEEIDEVILKLTDKPGLQSPAVNSRT